MYTTRINYTIDKYEIDARVDYATGLLSLWGSVLHMNLYMNQSVTSGFAKLIRFLLAW